MKFHRRSANNFQIKINNEQYNKQIINHIISKDENKNKNILTIYY
jgi:hypothetical protein